MGSIGKAAWLSLAGCWLATATAMAVLAAQPAEPPSILRVSSTRGPVTNPAVVTISPEALR